MQAFLESQLDYAHFFFAVALLLLANACLADKDRFKQRIPLLWLGLFGASMSLYELLELLSGSLGDAPAFAAIRAALLAVSLLFIVEFAREGTVRLYDRGPSRWVLVPFIIAATIGIYSGVHGFIAAAGYGIGLAGGIWASIILIACSKSVLGSSRPWLVSSAFSLFILSMLFIIPATDSSVALFGTGQIAALTGLTVEAVQSALLAAQAWLTLLVAISITRFNFLSTSADANAPGVAAGRHSFAPMAVVMLILTVGWFITEVVGDYGENTARKNLLSRTLTGVSAVDPDRVARLKGSPADQGTPDFEYLHSQLMAIRAGNPDCRFVYLLSMRNDKMIFLMDAEPKESKDYSTPGDVYEDALPRDFEDYKAGRTAVYEPYTDSWGRWVSGITPVISRDKRNIMAEFGMDVDARDWMRTISIYRLFCIVIAHFMCLMSILLFIVWHRTEEAAADSAALVERKKLEEERASFSAMVTQDLRSPLSAIYGYTDMLLTDMRDDLSGEAVAISEGIQENCKKLVNMIDDFMTLSRLEFGGIELKSSPTDIAKVVKEVVADTAVSVSAKGVTITKTIAADLPKPLLDKAQVQRAVAGLVMNALDHSPHGGSIGIEVGMKRNGGGNFLAISVHDAGKPIPEAEHPRVFDRHQVRTPGSVKRNGLGLAIVKAVATAHGGRVELVSVENMGNTFTIFLPVGTEGGI